MKLFQLRPRQPLLGLAGFAALGIFAADHWALPIVWIAAAAGIALVVTLLRPRTVFCWGAAALVFAALHTLQTRESAAVRLAERFAEGHKVVRATGIVWSEPEKPTMWSRSPQDAQPAS